jgi:ER-bound oxygenase mpaB/B'/Rubber oxygenase, catalytic domain
MESASSMQGGMRLDDDFLDACRTEGDPEGDALAARLFAGAAPAAADAAAPARRMLRAFVESDVVPDAWSPPFVREFLAAPLPKPLVPGPVIRRGEQLFATHGPEILTALGTYSLPAAYAANAGVKVLAQTGFLESHPTRRLVETAQMVVDVMRPGGLDPAGPGVRAARKVRLMHAAIRQLILTRTEPRWDTAALGVPINQEDLAGTLATFAWLPLDALRRMGVRVADADRDAYVRAWGVVGRLIGLREELVPDDAAQAAELSARIQARQVRPAVPNPDGRDLLRALLEMMEAKVPLRALRFGPASLMRLFLPRDVADALGVPRRPVVDLAVRAMARLVGVANDVADATALERRVFRSLNLAIIQAVLDHERGGKRAAFDLPLSLRGTWQLD